MLIALLVLADIFAIIASFTLTTYVWLGYGEMDQLANVLLTIIPMYIVLALNNKAYQINVLKHLWKNVSRGVIALLLAISSMLLILFFFKISTEFSRMMFSIGTLGATSIIILTRSFIFKFGKYYIGDSPDIDLCIFDDIPIDEKRFDGVGVIEASDYDLIADPSDAGAVTRLGQLALGMDHVIVYCSPEKRESWVFMLRALDVKSEIAVPELDSIAPLAIKQRGSRVSLLISAGHLRWDQRIVKRAFDLIVGLIAFIVVMPILIVTAIAIKLESKGPVLFKQERIGLGNRLFTMYKFRSMRIDEADTHGIKLTERNDPRLTAVGDFIRRTSIDEIPQLFNVLGGSMSLIGPRPHAPQSKAGTFLYWEIEQRYWHRHCIKPGITGLAQVSGYRGTTFVEDDLRQRLNSDLIYVANWSLLNDIKIILKTFAVLRHQNAF